MPLDDSLDALMENWHIQLSNTIDEIAPPPPAPVPSPNQISPMVYPGADAEEVGTETDREEIAMCL